MLTCPKCNGTGIARQPNGTCKTCDCFGTHETTRQFPKFTNLCAAHLFGRKSARAPHAGCPLCKEQIKNSLLADRMLYEAEVERLATSGPVG